MYVDAFRMFVSRKSTTPNSCGKILIKGYFKRVVNAEKQTPEKLEYIIRMTTAITLPNTIGNQTLQNNKCIIRYLVHSNHF